MEFIKIFPPCGNHEEIKLANQLIQKRIFNDALFEEIFIQASVILDSPVQLFYRDLWENAYLKRPDMLSVVANKRTTIMMSISECIQYLQSITPPKLKDLLDQNTQSIEGIYQSIVGVLDNDRTNPRYAYNITKFHEVFHLNMFENAWIPDYKKIAFARTKVHDEILCLVDASTISIDAIMKESHDMETDVWLQLNFHCDTEDGIENLHRFMRNNDIHISGVQCSDIGLFVSGYTSRLCPALRNMIRDVYTQFMQ